MKKTGMILISLMIFSASVYAGGQQGETEAMDSDKFKIAFIYIGAPGDLGWTYEHNRGKEMIEMKYANSVQVDHIEDVPEGPDATRVIRQYAQEGYNMIITTSFGYMDPTVEVAAEFPNIYFEHCSGYKTAENLSTYFGRMYQPRYLSGLVAGSMTEANVIGYVAAFPIPEVTRGINAFTIGVRKVNPDAVVKVIWTNTWYNPTQEREAAVALLDAGADIIAQHQDTTEPQKAAQERGKLSIGYDSDMRASVGDSVLTSPVWNWGSYYVRTVEAAMKGMWKSQQYWGGLEDGIVQLAKMSPLVPQDVQELVAKEGGKIVSGDWDVFMGPLSDQEGNLIVGDGEQIDRGTLLSESFFVEGVEGKLK